MIDVKQIRANPEALREAIRRRKVDPHLADVDRWLELDGQRRKLQVEVDGDNAWIPNLEYLEGLANESRP
mgnify:CR=1 FL=1